MDTAASGSIVGGGGEVCGVAVVPGTLPVAGGVIADTVRDGTGIDAGSVGVPERKKPR